MNSDSTKTEEKSAAASAPTKRAPAAKGRPRPAATKAGGGLGALPTIAIAALLGASLALALQWGLASSGMWPAAGSPQTASFEDWEARLDALERRPSGGAPTGETEALERSLGALEFRVAALEARPQAQTGGTGGVSAQELSGVEARLTRMEARVPENLAEQLGGLSDQLDGFVASERVDGLETRVAQLESDIQHTDTRRAARGLALAQLARAAQGSVPFTAELAAVAALRPDDARVSQLQPYADSGVATFAEIRAGFPAIARRATRAAGTSESPSAWQQVWSWLSQAISFRRTSEAEGAGASAIIARAEARLGEGNLAAALAEMDSLEGPARGAAAAWLADAQARVALDALIGSLAADVITDISG